MTSARLVEERALGDGARLKVPRSLVDAHPQEACLVVFARDAGGQLTHVAETGDDFDTPHVSLGFADRIDRKKWIVEPGVLFLSTDIAGLVYFLSSDTVLLHLRERGLSPRIPVLISY